MARPRRTLTRRTFFGRNPHHRAPGALVASLCAALIGLLDASPTAAARPIQFKQQDDQLEIRIDGEPFATYVFRDDEISRPYFCNVFAPCGERVTRPLPITDGELNDHPQMHPGLWLAFGDLSGEDYWRLKAPVVHAEFVETPHVHQGRGVFAVRNRYLSHDRQRVLCEEICRYTIDADEESTTILWDSTFEPRDETIVFGDQEEMGLGVRLTSAIAEKSADGGLLTNSEGRTTAARVWGKPARWCDYSGEVNGQPVGVTIAGHPDNLREGWWHARDYGFMAANLFGRRAMRQGEPSRIEVRPGEQFRLRYAVIFHNGRPGQGYQPPTRWPSAGESP